MSASLLFLWSSICLLSLCVIPVCVQILVIVTYYLLNSNNYYLAFQSVISKKRYLFSKLFYIYISKLRNPPLFFYSYFEINLLDKMTTTGSALFLLNQLLNLTATTLPTSVLPPSSSTVLSTASTISTVLPTSAPPLFSSPTLSSPSFILSTQLETRYLFGFLIIVTVFFARAILSVYRFVSRVLLLKSLRPSMSYFSTFHTILRTGTLEGKKKKYFFQF